MRGLVGSLLGFVLCVHAAGCYSVVDAVVDDVTDPGGMMTVAIDSGTPGTLPGLASGDPLAITAQSNSLVIALTCKADASGNSAAKILGTAGGRMVLDILAGNGNQLQVHSAGKSFIADAGTISLATNADGTISGSYATTGSVMGDGTAVTLTGTLTSIPRQK